MKVGFIGAGRMATTMSRHFLSAGHEVVLSSSRGPEELAGIVGDLGPAAKAGSKQEAVECDVVILATNWADAPEALSGRGEIYTFTVNYQPYSLDVAPPYVIALVVLDEQDDLRIVTNIVNCAPDDLHIGMRVRATFERHGEIYAPVFEPAA